MIEKENEKEHQHTRSKHYRLADGLYNIIVSNIIGVIDNVDCRIVVADLGECTCGAKAMIKGVAFFLDEKEAKQYVEIMQVAEHVMKNASNEQIQRAVALAKEVEEEIKT